MRWLSRMIALAFVSAVACSTTTDPVGGDAQNATSAPVLTRDFGRYPAIVEIDNARDVFAVSDIHGEYELVAGLLEANHLATTTMPDPTKAVWTGGDAILVVVGDLIDKGPHSIEVIDLVRALEASAPKSGGRVVTTMGNHEAEFLLDPLNHKATATGEDVEGIDVELASKQITPQSLASGTDPQGRGKWVASLPFGVRIKKWFFSHGGNTHALSVADLSSTLEHAYARAGFSDPDLTGDKSILEDQKWYGDPSDDNAGEKEARALGVKHLVFGHDPGALSDRGDIEISKNGILVKVDTAMGIHDGDRVGEPALLHVDTHDKDTAEALDAHGSAKKLL